MEMAYNYYIVGFQLKLLGGIIPLYSNNTIREYTLLMQNLCMCSHFYTFLGVEMPKLRHLEGFS